MVYLKCYTVIVIIHTVYRPEENIKFIEDWLNHHLAIGVEHFYLYDNGGSIGNFKKIGHGSIPGISKYKYKFPTNQLKEIREQEEKILSKYPVTKIMWSPKNANGQIVYNYNDSIFDFLSRVDKGLCAFIDMDEFIIKKEDFYPSRMLQKKFGHREEYDSVYNCYDAADIDTTRMDTKTILDLEELRSKIYNVKINPQMMHFDFMDNLQISANYYNHYNHNKYAHKILTKDVYGWRSPSLEEARKIKRYENVFYKVSDNNLKKFFI